MAALAGPGGLAVNAADAVHDSVQLRVYRVVAIGQEWAQHGQVELPEGVRDVNLTWGVPLRGGLHGI